MSKTQSPTPKLTDKQLVILSAGAQRTDHALFPSPQSLTVQGAALDKVIATLCKRKLAEERRIIDGAAEWRRDEDDRPLGLFITTSGLLALGDRGGRQGPALAGGGKHAAQTQDGGRTSHTVSVRKASPASSQAAQLRPRRPNRTW